MTDGDPGFDIWGMDVARYGDFATLEYTNEKVQENYSRRFRIQFPNEVLPAARPLETSPIYDRLVAENAVWADGYGLESALWFQKPGLDPIEEVTFGRSNAWDSVREETLAVRNGVGVMETTGFAKFVFDGADARSYLDSIITNKLPAPGRMVLAPMVNHNGKLIGDLTVACLGPTPGAAEGPRTTATGGATQNTSDRERFVVFGSGVATRFYERWFDQTIPPDADVTYTTLGWDLCGLAIAGPQARPCSNGSPRPTCLAKPSGSWTSGQLDLGPIPVWCGRVSFSGDLGYEFWMSSSRQRAVLDLIQREGEDLDLRLFGLHALDSLRLDKGFGTWGREYRPIYTPYEAGLERFVKLDKGEFIGRDALVEAKNSGPERRLLTWTVDTEAGRDGADVIGDEPVWHDGEVVGWVTSGGYSHYMDTSVAMGYVPAGLADAPGQFEVEILGVRRAATLVEGCLWDPEGQRMRKG